MNGRIFLRNRMWWLDYCVDGRRIRESTHSMNKKFAIELLSKRIVEIKENKYFDIRKKQKIMFKDFSLKYLSQYSIPNKKSSSRDAQSIKLLSEQFGSKFLYEITPEQIEIYKRERLKNVQEPTINRELACLKHIFTKAIEWNYVSENPVKKVKLFNEKNRRRLRYLEWNEIKSLVDACDQKIKPIVVTALHTGMRQGEIIKLKWSDINFNRRFIMIDRTKNNEKRDIPMSAYLTDMLLELKQKSQSAYIFANSSGKSLSRFGSIRKQFNDAVTKAEIENFHFHDLRHTFASHLVMGGFDLLTVKELLGHKSLEMTLRYAHLSSDHKRLAVESVIGSKFGTNMAQTIDAKILKVQNNLANLIIK